MNEPRDTPFSALRVPPDTSLPSRLPRYEKAQLAETSELPGYAGKYWDDTGNLHVYLTDSTRAAEATSKFEPLVRARPAGLTKRPSGSPQVIIHRARYDMAQLIRWKYLARSIVIQLPGTHSLGVSVESNGINIGVSTSEAGAKVVEALTAAGIPRDAIAFTVMPEPELAQATLSSWRDPIEGGINVGNYFYRNGTLNVNPCSMGLVMYFDNAPVVLGSSHCSGGNRGGLQGGMLHQPQVSGRLVGDELLDPEWLDWTWDSDCGFNSDGFPYYCRYSDTALWELAPGIQGYTARIARPLSPPGTGAGVSGSTTIDSNAPYFPVVSAYG